MGESSGLNFCFFGAMVKKGDALSSSRTSLSCFSLMRKGYKRIKTTALAYPLTFRFREDLKIGIRCFKSSFLSLNEWVPDCVTEVRGWTISWFWIILAHSKQCLTSVQACWKAGHSPSPCGCLPKGRIGSHKGSIQINQAATKNLPLGEVAVSRWGKSI